MQRIVGTMVLTNDDLPVLISRLCGECHTRCVKDTDLFFKLFFLSVEKLREIALETI